MDKEILQVLEFMKEVEIFKTMKRNCHKSNLESETNSDHTWHLCMFILLLKNKFKEKRLNIGKCLKIAVIHDLPEIYAGDEIPFKSNLKDKKKAEINASKKLFEKLPSDLETEFQELFFEYVEMSSKEGKIVRILDKLMPIIVNSITPNKYSAYRKNKVDAENCYEYVKKFAKEDDDLNSIFEMLFKEAKEKKIFYE